MKQEKKLGIVKNACNIINNNLLKILQWTLIVLNI